MPDDPAPEGTVPQTPEQARRSAAASAGPQPPPSGWQPIRLPSGEWFFDPGQPLGPAGGFGSVFLGRGPGHPEVAVKRLDIDAVEAAHRELRVAAEFAGKSFEHVIPVYDSGQDAESDRYFVVMARAERSLKDVLDTGRQFDSAETAHILLQVARGLAEAEAFVHRDLKPGNVLLHDGKWKVADFGIARFVEEATSSRTLKEFRTPAYAAPEQWRNERATHATDVYALGCVGYALLTGRPPYSAGASGEWQELHCQGTPPPLPDADPALAALLLGMLRKSPDGRPTLARVQAVLKSVAQRPASGGPTGAAGLLAQVGAELAAQSARSEAAMQAAQASRAGRVRLAKEAIAAFRAGIMGRLFEAITNAAPAARWCQSGKGDKGTAEGMMLGRAFLSVLLIPPDRGLRRDADVLPEGAFSRSGWDVVTAATIQVEQWQPAYEWAASLWYARLKGSDEYRWFEASYFGHPLAGTRRQFEPYGLTYDLAAADEAAAPGTSRHAIAFGPRPIDYDQVEEFCERWIGLLTQACRGELSYPRRLPLE